MILVQTIGDSGPVTNRLHHPAPGKRPQSPMNAGMRNVDGPADLPAGMLSPGPAEVPQNPHMRRSAQGFVEEPTEAPDVLVVSHGTEW